MTIVDSKAQSWEIVHDVFNDWIKNREYELNICHNAKPTIKMLIFLALIDAKKTCTYNEIREIFKTKNIIKGIVPDNTLRTSILNLGKMLDKLNHELELKSSRGNFQLIPRMFMSARTIASPKHQSPVMLLLDSPYIKAEDIAIELVEKARLPFHALYFLERSAHWWEIFSHNESQIRIQYEARSWEKLRIKDRLDNNTNDIISFVALAPGEGLSEIELLKKILNENPNKTVHYIAIDLSQRLLRGHINLLKESLTTEIDQDRIICVGIIADIFYNLSETINKVRNELVNSKLINQAHDFLPTTSGLLVTYLGNCLGNYYQDQETEIFSIIYSTFPNRPLEFLVGVSVMRSTADEYKRNWDDFLLQTPKYLLETNKLFESSRSPNDQHLPEFNLPKTGTSERCPLVVPELYIVRQGIEGQVYRFYYKLEYDLKLSTSLSKGIRSLPRGTLILLYNIVKYNMHTLIHGIEAFGLFKVEYDHNFHQIIDTPNGKREYAVFSAYLSK
ncbi:MAG: L-histidine N(alpha)-methyltransferase [Legionella sp.]|nr:L-histidine N(alpha)-methyltransferase [Legionella sp.]